MKGCQQSALSVDVMATFVNNALGSLGRSLLMGRVDLKEIPRLFRHSRCHKGKYLGRGCKWCIGEGGMIGKETAPPTRMVPLQSTITDQGSVLI